MGQKDNILREYLRDNRRFADLINGIAFHGKNVIRADEMKDRDPIFIYGKGRKKGKRERDIIKKVGEGTDAFYLACENQMEIHYAMPFRTLLYDSLLYDEQLDRIIRIHKKDRDLSGAAEFLSGIKEEDKFMAVVTFVCYYGVIR